MPALTAPTEVLVIDDDDDFRDSCVEVLTQSGFRAVGLANARDALTYLRSVVPRPLLILLDLMMADMDGWRFREQQRLDPLLADIPLLVMSASGRGPHADLPEAAFLSKLVEPEVLIAAVARWCRTPGPRD